MVTDNYAEKSENLPQAVMQHQTTRLWTVHIWLTTLSTNPAVKRSISGLIFHNTTYVFRSITKWDLTCVMTFNELFFTPYLYIIYYIYEYLLLACQLELKKDTLW